MFIFLFDAIIWKQKNRVLGFRIPFLRTPNDESRHKFANQHCGLPLHKSRNQRRI